MKDVDRKAPAVRSFTISGGSFGGEIVIDYRLPPPSPTDAIQSSSIHSLPSEFTHSGSSDRDTDDNETVASLATCATTQIKPNVEALQEMVAALTDIEKETAGRSSYQYSKLSDTIANRGPQIDRIRDNAAGEMAARHWVAEKGDTAKALQQFRKTIQYRIDRQATEITKCFEQDTETAKKLRTKVTKDLDPAGRLFVRGYDRQGRACFHFISRNAPSYSKMDPEGCMEVYFSILEKAIACTEKTLGTVIVRVDFKDFVKWHTPPLEFVKDMLVMLKDHYPERLHQVYLVDAPVVFRALWSLIKPFVFAGTKHKFQFVTGEHHRTQVFGSIIDADDSMPYPTKDTTELLLTRSTWMSSTASLTRWPMMRNRRR
jgi:hypothetical protein